MKKSLCLALVLLGLSNIPVECVQHSYIAQHQWTMRQWAGLALIAGGFPFALKSKKGRECDSNGWILSKLIVYAGQRREMTFLQGWVLRTRIRYSG